jgi:hypothetical protein
MVLFGGSDDGCVHDRVLQHPGHRDLGHEHTAVQYGAAGYQSNCWPPATAGNRLKSSFFDRASSSAGVRASTSRMSAWYLPMLQADRLEYALVV